MMSVCLYSAKTIRGARNYSERFQADLIHKIFINHEMASGYTVIFNFSI